MMMTLMTVDYDVGGDVKYNGSDDANDNAPSFSVCVNIVLFSFHMFREIEDIQEPQECLVRQEKW